MTNNTNIKVAEKNKEIVASIMDYNDGEPLQKNRGKWYRYRVTFVDGSYYESNSKSEIATRIVYEAINNREFILKSEKENELQEEKEWQEYLSLQQETSKEEKEFTKEGIGHVDGEDEVTIKAKDKFNKIQKQLKTLKKYRVYDLLDGREVLAHADTIEQVHEIAQEQYDDTDGDCDIHYAELNQETNKYKFTFVKRVTLKGND